MRIDKPGFYTLTDDEYFADPCPSPSLTQTVAKLLLNRSALHAWTAHPRLNPDWEADGDPRFAIGTVAHALLFDSGKPIHVLDYPDMRTKAAKEERDNAIAAGHTPITRALYDRAKLMVRAFKDQITLIELSGGHEQAAIAQDGNTWLRTKIDWIDRKTATLIIDYKTTSANVTMDMIPAYAWRAGWHIQAAMHEHILNLITPENTGRLRHYFLLQENYEPFAIYKCRISESSMEAGRHDLRKAIALWETCMASNTWPGPGNDIVPVVPPGWALHDSALQDEEEAADAKI